MDLVAARRRTRRRLAPWLLAWGGAGLVILGLALGFVNGVLTGDAGPLGLEGQRRQLVRLLDASNSALADARAAAANADGSLVAAGAAASSAGGFMTELSGTMSELAGSLRISIFGSQPFAAAADDFERVAASAAQVAIDLERAGTAVRLGGEDMATLAAELETVEAEVVRMRDGVSGLLDTRGWQVMATIVIAWLGVPALVSFLVGFRWWRQARRGRGARRSVPAPERTTRTASNG
jgi:hypothetical protein